MDTERRRNIEAIEFVPPETFEYRSRF